MGEGNTYISSILSVHAFPPKRIFHAMKQPLSLWLGHEKFTNLLIIADEIPICSGLFLEVHLTPLQPRCDIAIRLMASDGTLSALLRDSAVQTNSVWCKTTAVLARWQQQLYNQKGALRTHCFAMGLEFDVYAHKSRPGDPAMFIALTPQADIGELADELIDYPDFQHAILTSMRLLRRLIGSDSLILGHIGVMASRLNENTALPLRSCWRCDDISHVYELLRRAGIAFDRSILQEQISRLECVHEYINGIMLVLDSRASFNSDFALEVNVFNSRNPSRERENALLQAIVWLGLMSIEQKQKLLEFSNRYVVMKQGRLVDCSLHHIKLKLSDSRLREVKCYWFVSADKRTRG